MAEKAMVLFSGGVDSTTCLGLAIEKFGKENVIPLSIHYGQKHDKEVEAARKILDHYGMEGMEMDLSGIFAYSNCSLLEHSDEEIPEASYAEQLKGSEGTPVSTTGCSCPARRASLLQKDAAASITERIRTTRREAPTRTAARASIRVWTRPCTREAGMRCISRRRLSG